MISALTKGKDYFYSGSILILIIIINDAKLESLASKQYFDEIGKRSENGTG
ncbi:hypothetical protein J2TS6_25620 [Paenibacillus albilobatus]|uniref:Uncharacterized protein n=1 Tax=Paenibacillus albilobatus TaxID=2716884 RepID=A0A920C9M9_9BACL|nr:hypothetical protein J2TS6_25620 [Paenibacillus albilobatus]